MDNSKYFANQEMIAHDEPEVLRLISACQPVQLHFLEQVLHRASSTWAGQYLCIYASGGVPSAVAHGVVQDDI